MPTEPIQWYVRVGNVERGPISSETLKQLAQQGKIKPDMLLRRGPTGEWVAASRWKGLLPAAAASGAPAPVAAQPRAASPPGAVKPVAPKPPVRPAPPAVKRPARVPPPARVARPTPVAPAAPAAAPLPDTAPTEEAPAPVSPPEPAAEPVAVEPVAPAADVPDAAEVDEALAAAPPESAVQPAPEESPAPEAIGQQKLPARRQKPETDIHRGTVSNLGRLVGIALAIVGVLVMGGALIIGRVYLLTPADELLGKWEMVGSDDRIQFSSDKRVTLTHGAGQLSGEWSHQAHGRLKIEGKGLGTASGDVYDVKIDGDNLTLKKLDGPETKYKRVSVWTKDI